jgi:hypothetical protein
MVDEVLQWVPLHGRWQTHNGAITFDGLEAPEFGIALANKALSEGSIDAAVAINEQPELREVDALAALQADKRLSAQIIVGFEPAGVSLAQAFGTFVAVGLGGSGFAGAYLFSPSPGGWTALQTIGEPSNIEFGRRYKLHVMLQGQFLRLFVDGIETIHLPLAQPLSGKGTGLFIQGKWKVTFEDFRLLSEPPRGFAIMEFSEKFQALYTDVLQPVAKREGLALVRADEIPGPGFIISDIVRSLWESSMVIAEISATNANVFFEVGFAYALGKPMILLAEKGRTLPFDVSGMRVIFYDDSIGGKARVEAEFTRHLRAILNR